MYRLLAIDLDGTLLPPDHIITQRTHTILQRAARAEIRIVIATGRVPTIFRSLLGQLPLNAPQITSNGAAIIDLQTNCVMHEQFVPAAAVLPAIEALRSLDLQICYYTSKHLYMEKPFYATYESNYLANIAAIEIDDITSIAQQPCLKLGAFGDVSSIRAKRLQLERLFKGQLYVTQTSPRWLEILHPDVSKANALKIIVQSFKIKPEEVLAIGDNHNDIEMLRFAGLGIAMGNAHDEVKSVADYVTLKNTEDGVAVALEKFLSL
jgi:Cof subfamily protein (haloacid dehalogenase superfamily)